MFKRYQSKTPPSDDRKNTKGRNKPKARGFTLLEVLMVLVVATALLALALVVYRQTLETGRASESLEELVEIYNGTISTYSDSATVWSNPATTVSSKIVAASGALPKKYISHGDIVSWNGMSVLMGYGNVGNSPPGFYVELQAQNNDTCAFLVTQIYGDNVSAVSVNGKTVMGLWTTHPGPLTVSEESENCQTRNTIRFYYSP